MFKSKSTLYIHSNFLTFREREYLPVTVTSALLVILHIRCGAARSFVVGQNAMRVWWFLLVVVLTLVDVVECGEDFYELLGIARDADDRAIRRAFKKLALKFHPDKNKVICLFLVLVFFRLYIL